MNMRTCMFSAALLPAMVLASAQQESPTGKASGRSVQLDVVVTPKSGPPVAGLQQQDFTLIDNKSVQPIRSFRAVSKGQDPIQVILVLDAVNTAFSTVAYERGGVREFLLANGGHLANPTTIAILTDHGIKMQPSFSTDGNALNTLLDKEAIGLREITRSTGFWGANDRVKISLNAVQQLTAYAETIPGRKFILWISPGWPLLSGAHIQLDGRQQEQIFGDVVHFSAGLRAAGVTLYNVNPIGPGESLLRADYYEAFLKGVSKPSQVDLGDLGVQVLAVQSGGLALESNSDVAAMLEKCIADTEAWYEIGFEMAAPERRNEYHHVSIKLDKPGLNARTRDGYYAQPLP